MRAVNTMTIGGAKADTDLLGRELLMGFWVVTRQVFPGSEQKVRDVCASSTAARKDGCWNALGPLRYTFTETNQKYKHARRV